MCIFVMGGNLVGEYQYKFDGIFCSFIHKAETPLDSWRVTQNSNCCWHYPHISMYIVHISIYICCSVYHFGWFFFIIQVGIKMEKIIKRKCTAVYFKHWWPRWGRSNSVWWSTHESFMTLEKEIESLLPNSVKCNGVFKVKQNGRWRHISIMVCTFFF